MISSKLPLLYVSLPRFCICTHFRTSNVKHASACVNSQTATVLPPKMAAQQHLFPPLRRRNGLRRRQRSQIILLGPNLMRPSPQVRT